MPTIEQTDDRLKAALRERGLRVTPQRLVINRVLHRLSRHASAEEVMSAVGDHLPNVSLPTVYATLELLEELGLARRVAHAGGRTLFDPRLEDHAHLVCSRCGRVEDLDIAVDTGAALAAAGRRGYESPRAGVVVTGVCRSCAHAD